MSDIATENYKKAVQKAVDRFGDRMDKIAKQMQPVSDDLDKTAAIKSPTDDDKKHLADLKKQMQAFQTQMDNAALALRTDLMLLELPKNADPKEASKLPGWMQEIIKKKGVPLGKDVSVRPDIDFDVRAMKLKKVAVVFTIDLP